MMQSLGAKQTLEDSPNKDSLNTKNTLFGQISFINNLPVVLPFERDKIKSNCRISYGTPQELNHLLETKKLDLGAMSSFYFLESGEFELFKGLSISGTGKVGSVLLFSKVDLGELDGKTIEVPNSSATSIRLMQLLLKEEYAVSPVLQLESEQSKTECEARLLIGDKALKEDDRQNPHYLRIDLAQWWFSRYGLPFVFGLWGARKTWLEDNRTEFESINQSLLEARDLGLSIMLSDVIDEASSRTGLNAERLSCYYLDELDYALKDEHERALALFDELCRHHGFISA